MFKDVLKTELQQLVLGQEKAVDLTAYVGSLYSQIKAQIELGSHIEDLPRINLLYTGPTGTGKTYITKKLAQILNLPYYRIDCSSITASGWAGVNLEDVLGDFMKNVPDGFGILHLDEFDKISSARDQNYEGKQDLQKNMLDLIDGEYTLAPANLSRALIVMSGSFQDTREEDKRKPAIGFNNSGDVAAKKDWKQRLYDLGFMQELAGRIVISAELDPYTDAELENIIENSPEGPLVKYRSLFGERFTFTKKDKQTIVKKVKGSKFGLREINSVVFRHVYENNI